MKANIEEMGISAGQQGKSSIQKAKIVYHKARPNFGVLVLFFSRSSHLDKLDNAIFKSKLSSFLLSQTKMLLCQFDIIIKHYLSALTCFVNKSHAKSRSTHCVTPPKLLSTTNAVILSFISPVFSSFNGVLANTVKISARPPLL